MRAYVQQVNQDSSFYLASLQAAHWFWDRGYEVVSFRFADIQSGALDPWLLQRPPQSRSTDCFGPSNDRWSSTSRARSPARRRLDDSRRAHIERDRFAFRAFNARRDQLHAARASAAMFVADGEDAGRDGG